MKPQEAIEKLITLVESGRLFVLPEDVDAALDRRDDATFERLWLKSYEGLGCKTPLAGSDGMLEDRLSQAVFRVGHKLIGDVHELTEYIAEDFLLIARSVLVGRPAPFVNGLLNHYLSGEFPTTVDEVELPTATTMIDRA